MEPKCTTNPDGRKLWTLDFQLHRIDGPAVEYPDGTKAWYLHGKRHRTDGPAIEFPEGTMMWFLDDVCITPKTLVERGYMTEGDLMLYFL